MKDFEAYRIGLDAASVCSSLSQDETVRRMNADHVLPSPLCWHLSKDKTFRGGEPNPCPCDRAPETHKHYLMNC